MRYTGVEQPNTTGAAIGGQRCCTVAPCDCSHVAPGNSSGRDDGAASAQSVVRQASAAVRDTGGMRGRRSKHMVRSLSLPLTTVDGAAGLALCVEDLASRAHLQLSARGRGGRVQRIEGAVRSRGSGHGGDGGCAGELLGS